jgi:carbon starvation protein CstA
MWRTADQPPLRAPVAFGAALADGLAAIVIVVWLFSGKIDYLSTFGTALLIAIVVVLVAFTALKFRIANERPAAEELTRSE